MTDYERMIISKLRTDGISMVEISRLTSIPYNTIKSYFRRHNNKLPKTMKCLNCGKPIKVIYGKKIKRYCNDHCRISYWNKQYKNKGDNQNVKTKEN